MKYLIFSTDKSTPFISKYFDATNHWSEQITMVVDMIKKTFTTNGVDWFDLEVDHL